MKKSILLILILISGALVLYGFKFEEKDSLYNFTKPYTGIYKCQSADLSGKEILNGFKYITLELTPKGKLIFSAREKLGFKEKTFSYDYEMKDGKLIIKNDGGNILTDYKNGKITMFYSSGGKSVTAVFERK